MEKPTVDSLLFAVALAVGIAPELLPAILSLTLSKGALHMAKRGVIVRTRRPLFRSRPGRWLGITTLAVAIATVALPYLPPIAELFAFEPLPVHILLWIAGITLAYAAANELVKKHFFRWATRRARYQ